MKKYPRRKSMKKLLIVGLMAALAAGVFAQAAPQNQIDLGGGYYGTDLTGVYSNFQGSNNGGQSAKYSPSLNWNGKYTFTLPLDAANTLKFALADDGWFGLYSGSKTNNAQESGQNTGLITPLVEYLGFGADVTLSLPIYYFGPTDAGGYNELKYAYKETGYLPIGPSTSLPTTNNYPIGSNNVVTTTDLKGFYKYSFDKTTWVSGGADFLLALAPTPWLTFIKPKVSGGAYGVQLDVQFDYFNAYNNNSAYYDTYLEPKLTYDLGFLNLVAGLKPYVSSRISLSTSNPAWTVSGSAQPFHDSFVQPGLAYSYTIAQVGTFGIDAGWRFAKVDNVGTFNAAGTGYANNVAGNANKNDVVPYSELRIAVSYTYKF